MSAIVNGYTVQMVAGCNREDPNTKHHEVGDLVIHRADAKRNEWLMRVVSYTADGQVRTVYAFQPGDKRRWENLLAVLFDPRRSDIRERWRGPAFEDGDE